MCLSFASVSCLAQNKQSLEAAVKINRFSSFNPCTIYFVPNSGSAVVLSVVVDGDAFLDDCDDVDLDGFDDLRTY